MGTFQNNGRGVGIRAGVVTAADVTVAPSAPSSRLTLLDSDSGTTFALGWFVLAVIMLWFVL